MSDTTTRSPVADAVERGVLGERVWFYANYHCNLACSYCLTESTPDAERRLLEPDWLVERATEAASLGFRSLGVTGGEPFMVASMPDTIARLSEVLPVVVLSNATLFQGPRMERIAAAFPGSADPDPGVARRTRRRAQRHQAR